MTHKKHNKQPQTDATTDKSIIGKILSYAKNIIGYVSLTNLVKILAISSATSQVTGAMAAQCQTYMPIPFECSFPVIHPGSLGEGEYVSSTIPEKNFTTAQILCKFSTDYQGKEGVDFGFNPPYPGKACKLKEDGACEYPFSAVVKKGETLSIVIPPLSTEERRRAPTIETLFPQCDYHEEECTTSASSLFISCSPQ